MLGVIDAYAIVRDMVSIGVPAFVSMLFIFLDHLVLDYVVAAEMPADF